jgi:UDP-N-acetylmuramyl pentapeptide phosphotransferase/UDP-N-acetylglucosamine-1-phosphate transferase
MTLLHMLANPAVAIVLGLLVAIAMTAVALRYARGRGLLDQPGQRRSHDTPTPRGGGVGLVAGALLGMSGALFTGYPAALAAAFMLAALVIAGVGWWDDHASLPVWPRLLVQLVVACGFALVLVLASGTHWWALVLLIPGAVWSVNLHNFMDGIDGLLGLQLVFVGIAMAVGMWAAGLFDLATATAVLAAAAVGFLLFNRPPARIFMGDVGSACAGLLVFMLAALWCVRFPRAIWVVLILNTGFMMDSGLTLSRRILSGRRWYTAHREHLYQWLVRSGWTHGQTGCLYLAFNVIICAPVAWLASVRTAWAPGLCVALYALTAVLWMWGRRACLQSSRRRSGRAHA